MKKRILIIDDDARILFVLQNLLVSHGYSVQTLEKGDLALQTLQDFLPDLLLLDLQMPEIDGLELLDRIWEQNYSGKIIIITGFGTISSAVAAMKKGAYDYITKPFDNQDLLLSIERALHTNSVEKQLEEANKLLANRFNIDGIITKNHAMKDLLKTARRVAPIDVTVLIQGESGTGKELLAHSIHNHSNRKGRRFVALNCSTLPATLAESELFGHKKGSFTGATTSKRGLVEEAHEGTLFLDEIGDLDQEIQKKLLRFLQSGEFYSVGNTEPNQVDVRIIAATHKNLEHQITEGLFREDLYFRLNVVKLWLPPLRNRREDIPILVDHFLHKTQEEFELSDLTITPAALRLLMSYNWPGNIRELENVIRSAAAVSETSCIQPDSLHASLTLPGEKDIEGVQQKNQGLSEITEQAIAMIERNYILEVLERHNGNRTKAAKELKIGRNTLIKKMKALGLYDLF